jgi:hypothetical protein
VNDPAPWDILVPERLNAEIASLTPGERRAVYTCLKQLADDPRTGAEEPVPGAELRRILTAPAIDTGDQVTLLYRVHPADHRVEIVWFLAGP